MTGITSAVGIGSGIDINGTVSQLTAAEGKPQLDAIAAKTTISQAKVSGLGTLKGALSAFQNAVKMLDQSTTFQAQQITSSDEKILKVTADPASTAAAHTIKINALAVAQKSVASTEFSSTDVVKAGTLAFTDNSGKSLFSVVVTAGQNDTLTGLRDAINVAKGNNTVVASVINVDSKTSPGTTVSKLVLTAKTPGTANSFSIDASQGDARFNLSSTTPTNFGTTKATDANLLIDPQPMVATPQNSTSNVEFGSTDTIAPGLISFNDSKGMLKFSVNVTSGNNDTPIKFMNAVNNAVGNDNVQASIISVPSTTNPGTSSYKLVFESKQSGVDNQFSIDASAGDSRLTLNNSQGNAQQSISATTFTSTDKVTPGTLAFKDATGATKFSVNITSSATTTVDANGNSVTTDANGNYVDVNGNPLTQDASGNYIDNNGNSVILTTQTVAGNDTLAQLRDAINYNPENKLVLASIVTTQTPATTVDTGTVDSQGNPILTTTPGSSISQLELTALNPGAAKGFTVDGSAGDTRFTLDPINAAANFTTSTTVSAYNTVTATNANDGGESVTRSSNTISDAIPGVSLNLMSTGSVDINVQQDQAAISKPISAFVDAYNTLTNSLQQLTNYVGPGSTSNGPLLGDSVVQTIASQVKDIINNRVSSSTGSYNSLNQIGIIFDKKGVMSLDSAVLQKAVTTNLTSVGNIFASTAGIATQLNAKITTYLDAKGALSTEQDSLNKTLTNLTQQKADVQTRLDATQKSLLAQFTAMDSAVAQFKNTGTFLTQAFAPKPTN